jgi:hypothetical protein
MAGWNRKTFAEEILSKLGTLPDYRLAQVAGCTKKAIARVRRERGIKSFAKITGRNGQFQRGHFPARWLARGGG